VAGLLPPNHPGPAPLSNARAKCALSFRGTFDFTLDAKNRLTVPSRYRASFADGVVLAKGLEPCVGMWRPSDYDEWTSSVLASHNPLSPDYRQLERFFTANSHSTELDGAGRVMVPGFLMGHAALDREVSLIGSGVRFEIWDRNAWGSYNDDLSSSIADIAAGLGTAQ
jgi:MraZ protein